MKLNQLLQKSLRMLIALLVVGAFVVPAKEAKAQLPNALPTLSLTGENRGYDKAWYPDGRMRITLRKSAADQKEVLVPVFIRWKEIPDPMTGQTNHIYSFSMNLRYDKSVFEPIGIVTENPNLPDPSRFSADERGTVAHTFDITFDTYDDEKFLHWLDINDPNNTKNKNGATMKIVGVSPRPLPSTLDNGREVYKPFFYVRMKVVPEMTAETFKKGYMTWFIIDADSLYYNKVQVPAAPDYTGVGGIDMAKSNTLWNTEPYRKGALMVVTQDKFPKFDFFMHRLPGIIYQDGQEAIMPVQIDDNGRTILGPEYEIKDPISVDYKRTKDEFIYGERQVHLKNITIGSRMNDVIMESDAPWLEFRAYEKTDNLVKEFGVYDYLPYIDNGILGTSYEPTNKDRKTTPQREMLLDIRCNPEKVNPVAGEMEGTYVGYITFKSKDAEFDPVRLKVTFNLLRNAYEPHLYESEVPAGVTPIHTGIRLNMKRFGSDEVQKLVFGTAPRATEGIDTLMGERAQIEEMDPNKFEARFFSLNPEVAATVPHGFADALPDINRPDYDSRDIRDVKDTLQSLTYYVKFKTQKYPVYITWNTNDFPEGAILYIKDLQTKGNKINVNMREGTAMDANGNMSYTFTDATLDDFIIEYTVPRLFTYEEDKPGYGSIKKGWNLLSLPVRVNNAKIKDVYPNSVNNSVITFFPSGWEQYTEALKPGMGYFILYNNIIDNTFRGIVMKNIGKENGDKIAIWKGWNLIGTVSVPISVNNVSFDAIRPQDLTPDLEFVRGYGFWRYYTANGYKQVNMLEPGFGYFMKAGKGTVELEDVGQSEKIAAYLRVSATQAAPKVAYRNNSKEDAIQASTNINLFDSKQANATLYLSDDNRLNVEMFEMPPALGEEFFDVRFKGNTNLSNSEKAMIELRGVEYPVSINANSNNSDLFFYDALTNEYLGTIAKGSNGNIEITSTAANTINVVKGKAQVTVTPNPVAINASVNYYAPVKGNVTVTVYNSLGNVVANYEADAVMGNNSYSFNVNTLASGNYIVKVSGSSFSNVSSFTVVK